MQIEKLVKITDEEILAALNNVEFEKLLQLLDDYTEEYGNWEIDMKMADYWVNKVYQGFIKNNFTDIDIPESLNPLIIRAMKENILEAKEDKDYEPILDLVGGADDLLTAYERGKEAGGAIESFRISQELSAREKLSKIKTLLYENQGEI